MKLADFGDVIHCTKYKFYCLSPPNFPASEVDVSGFWQNISTIALL